MSDEIKVDLTHRSVIERKLLDAISRDDCVAVLLSKVDLCGVIVALRKVNLPEMNDLLRGLEQLHKEAFR